MSKALSPEEMEKVIERREQTHQFPSNYLLKKIETLEQRVAGLTEAILTLTGGSLCLECYQILEDSEEHWHKNG